MHIYIYIFTIKDEEKGKDNNKISDGSTKKKTCFCANIFLVCQQFSNEFLQIENLSNSTSIMSIWLSRK